MVDKLINFILDIFSFNPDSPLLFTQHYFWIFFVAVFSVFSLIHSKVLMRNAFLFFVSVFFYYKTSGWFTLILVFATFFNFFDGARIYKSKSNGAKPFYRWRYSDLPPYCYLSAIGIKRKSTRLGRDTSGFC